MPESLPITALSEEIIAARAVDDGTPQLTRLLAAGDERSWREFHDDYRHRLRGYLFTIWYGPDEALDDLVQETLLRAVKHMRVFGDQQSLWSWLTVLAQSATADAGRKRGRWRRLLDGLAGEPREPAHWEPVGLEQAVKRLPAAAATLIRMKYEENCSVRRMAEKLGLSEKAVESRLGRARRRLRKELDRIS